MREVAFNSDCASQSRTVLNSTLSSLPVDAQQFGVF